MYPIRQNRNCLLGLAIAAGILATPVSALAQNADPGIYHHYPMQQQQRPQATLMAQAVAEIAQDTVRITLATEISDKTQAAVAKALSKALEDVMKRAKGHEGIKVTSGDYRLWPMNNEQGKITNWRGRGEILLESKDFGAASELASTLSDSMPVAGFHFFVSPRTRAEKEQALLTEAAEAFRDRAQALAKAFGYAGFEIKQVDLNGAGARYEQAYAARAPRMSMAADKVAAAVPLEGGTDMVTVSVRGSIFLLKDKK